MGGDDKRVLNVYPACPVGRNDCIRVQCLSVYPVKSITYFAEVECGTYSSGVSPASPGLKPEDSNSSKLNI